MSGAFFPLAGTPDALRWVMLANPVTHGVTLLRYGLEGLPPSVAGTTLGLGTAAAVSVGGAALALAWAAATARRPVY